MHIPLLCVVTPRLLTSSIPISSIKRKIAWCAPRALNAPIFCWFSHLNHSRIFGLGASEPVVVLGEADGLLTIRSSVFEVRRGVWWM